MKILVVGDAMIDRYWVGRIERLNPEKHSAPLLRYWQLPQDFPGGATNVAANLRAMGAEVCEVYQSSGEVVKNRLIDSDGVVARFDCDDVCGSVYLSELKKKSEGCSAVMVSNYGKGAITTEVATMVKSLNLPTFVDTKIAPHLWTEWCTAMFPNQEECRRHRADYRETALCVIKCGAGGLQVWRHGSLSFCVPSKAKCVRNVAGAGDTTFAAFVATYLATLPKYTDVSAHLTQCACVAMDFASVAVSHVTTVAPTFNSVYELRGHEPLGYPQIAEEIRK